MNSTLSRSDALKPLAWLVGLLLGAVPLFLLASAPSWAIVVMMTILGFAVALYLIAYSYCLVRDRDALRSEKYSLSKMAIEHNLIGDSSSGLFDSAQVSVKTTQSAAKALEHKQ